MSDDKINHPPHYGGDGNQYEAIRVIEACGWLEGFCKGNALKYLMRAGKKDGEPEARDLEKAEWYIRYWREHGVVNLSQRLARAKGNATS